ncbi:MAG: phospho-N-acetylmuramoyl-pentapeptide-transferase [Cryomorphaceae bacterium]|jgi:phospho-N-acetylmuramoyl-pentapeptide-transferase|nr:phospho-N-acetylmuramoyl-pentapeptide-transferase [Cryomorphaceae bacterium]MBT3503298.1 phospho-N-acetylmuramoyl-pentapeptide-transferase [Cryomorphaceae bacterium]MBT3689680.1 phospho-N-acetylmuramoyl-pentapeptide-transferase [Cryomorphaceae bacterium]MBT4221761.1 phospho-N-acetylmuramoyl-pentapeptide-transferase [Cryomorphaceae bacterium]MBT4293228.1 phospho-N-acetylmuramoyl-pentapeptide-transferase [Cryomorphaceae bacterium]
MLYHLFEILESQFNFPGASLFSYLSFRAGVSVLISLIISVIFGKKIINYLIRKQIGENIRELGLDGEDKKVGTPTMGGLIIIIGTLIPVILMSNLENIYIQILIFSTLMLGTIGFVDDYIKVFKKDKKGLKGKFKIAGQSLLGIFVALILLSNNDITIVEFDKNLNNDKIEFSELQEVKSFKTTIPFFKNNELDYSEISNAIFKHGDRLLWIILIPVIIFIISAVSNSNNLTDGLDGLSAGLSAIIVFTLGVFAWTSGNIIFSDYLNIMYIPRVGEITIFIAALLGSLVGFLWYNTYPATVFMGDTGSLTVGGLIAVISILIRKELLIPILCGVFLLEALSVIFQVSYFKITKRRTGIGKRIFLMSPIHHHFQKAGYHESKIVSRLWIVGIFLALITILTLKIR